MDHQWNVDQRVVETVLVVHRPVIADIFAGVSRNDENRILLLAGLF
jgi:hypothetical protein